MKVLPTRLPGVILLEPEVHQDERGFFLETSRRDELEQLGIRDEFVQENHSRSVRNTLRGLHYQAGHRQAKLVRVARGRIWDVALDLRRDSPTYGVWEAFTLDDETHRSVYIPGGFAHGFCVISDVADVLYRVSAYYDAKFERGVAWDDPVLGIKWPVPEPLMSQRDRENPRLRELS
jgi:dTDP-4-dehydrorhamnose 3,5-epimerase